MRRGAMLCLIAGLGHCPAAGGDETQATPTYTNEDLRRLSPYRGETGVLSKPPSPEASKPAAEPKPRGEEYWRREAERLRSRLRPLKRRAEELRLRLEETKAAEWRKRSGGRRSDGGTSSQGVQRRLESVESEIREREDELLARARREGALPGWLR